MGTGIKTSEKNEKCLKSLFALIENSLLPTVTATASMQCAAVLYQRKIFQLIILTGVIVKAVLEKY